jgi:hypothetical protein
MNNTKKSKALEMIERLVNSKLEVDLHLAYQSVLKELQKQRIKTLHKEAEMNHLISQEATSEYDNAIDDEEFESLDGILDSS